MTSLHQPILQTLSGAIWVSLWSARGHTRKDDDGGTG
jgi:hypothetical protein